MDYPNQKRIKKIISIIDEFGHEQFILVEGYDIKGIGQFLNRGDCFDINSELTQRKDN